MSNILSFDSVPYNEDYRLSSSTLWQIMVGIDEIKKKIIVPKNDYQKVMYPLLTELIDDIKNGFLLLLNYESDDDKEIIEYHLGMCGKLPQQIKMMFHHKIKIGKSNFEPLIKAATQRITFILNRRMPPHYITTENINKSHAFDKFRLKMKIFSELFKNAAQEWATIVKVTRENLNIKPSERFNDINKHMLNDKK
jgi:hypothetical protein